MELEFVLLVTTVSGLILGGVSINWARSERPRRSAWGRRLFIGTLLFLTAIGLVAAVQRADGLVPLGLLAGLLVVCMLWESPVMTERAPIR